MSAVTKAFRISLDIKAQSDTEPVEVTDGDTGTVLKIDVTDGTSSVDLTSCYVVLVFSHSRGVFSQDSEDGSVTVDGSSVTVCLRPSSFSPTAVECEMKIYSAASASRDSLITSARFNLSCKASILDESAIHSDPQFPMLTSLISSVEAAEAVRQANETTRQSNEATRQTNETTRQSNEATRQSNEAARQAAVQTAVSNANTAAAAADAAAAAALSAAQNGHELAESAASSIAPKFSASASYSAGDYVTHNGVLFRFLEDHSAGAWVSTVTHVSRVTVSGSMKVTDSLSALNTAANEGKVLTFSSGQLTVKSVTELIPDGDEVSY